MNPVEDTESIAEFEEASLASSRDFAENAATTRKTYARYATAANAVSLALQGVVSLMAVRWTLYYLGDERFGLWMTVLGIGGFLSFADLGIGNALVTRVASARAHAAGVSTQVVVTGGLAVVAALGASIGMIGALVCGLLPWEAILGRQNSAALCSEFRVSSVVFAILFGLSVFSMAVRKIYEGLQRGYASHLVACIAACLSFGCIYLASHEFVGIPLLLLSTYGVTTAVPLVLLIPLVMKRLLKPSRLIVDGKHEARHLLHVGSQYTLVQLGSLLLNGSEAMMISGIQGAAALTGLSIVQRLFQFAATPARILIAPYWGAYADAHARGHREYVRRTLIRQLQVSGILTAIAAVVMAVLSGWIIPLWTNGAKTADMSVVIACCCLYALDGAMLPFGVYLNGTGCVRPQAVATVFALFTYFPAKIVALAVGGVPAMIWTTIVFQILNTLLFYGVLYRDEVWRAIREN
jgi:O-antigen/teichoic acid export membrane protein